MFIRRYKKIQEDTVVKEDTTKSTKLFEIILLENAAVTLNLNKENALFRRPWHRFTCK